MGNYQDKNIVIIGLGVTGLSCIHYFLAQGIIPKVIDTRKNPTEQHQLDQCIEYHFGNLHSPWIMAADLIVVSPGIALSTPEIAQAIQAGIEVIGDIELFCREINRRPEKKIIAITGSNGKTTVTSLVGEMARQANIAVGVGGNIMPPALTLLTQNNDLYVLELSSFQLETTNSLQATAATILNVTEDHMDRYPDGIVAYRQAKLRIYDRAKNCIVNHDDLLTFPEERHHKQPCITFGLTNAEYCLDETQHELVIKGEKIIAVNKLRLIGLHNYFNALAALALADCVGIPRSASLVALTNFQGLAHRFQKVYQHNGVTWIDDSKATNVGSTIAALKSTVCKGVLYLLLGGDGKDADFSPLIPYLADQVVIYCFGKDKGLLARLNPAKTVCVNTMEEAIRHLASLIKAEDIVLLSPACASLDQFHNYIHRGNEFARLAKEYG